MKTKNSYKKVLTEKGYEIIIITGVDGMNSEDDNVDVEVHFDNGEKYASTFFTIQNIKSLFEKNKITGECSGGLYFWASDMIIVEKITEDTICATIKNLIQEDMFRTVFFKIT